MNPTTDTPRTEAYVLNALPEAVPAEWARQLERELNAHKKDALKGLELADEWAEKCVKAEAEVKMLNNILENTRMSRDTMIEDRNLTDQELDASKAEVERLDKERREISRELHLWEMGMYHKPKMQAKIDELKAEVERLRGLLQQAVEIAEVFESELDEYHSVDRNCPDAAWHYPDGWERSEEAKDKLERLRRDLDSTDTQS